MSPINSVLKNKLIRCYENGCNFLSLADSVEIKRKTARQIIWRYSTGRSQLQHGDHKVKTILKEMGAFFLINCPRIAPQK